MMNMSGIASGKVTHPVVDSDTLEHVPDPVRALQECRRVLVLGGVLLHGAHRGGAMNPLATRPPPQLSRWRQVGRERRVGTLPRPNRVRRGCLAASPESRLR